VSSRNESFSLPEPPGGNRSAITWVWHARPYIKELVKDKEVSYAACADVLFAIAYHVALYNEPKATLSFDTIADKSGVSRRTVVKAVPLLEKIGLIEVMRRGRNVPNTYFFTVPDKLGASTATEQKVEDHREAPRESTPGPARRPAKPQFDALAYLEKLEEPIAGFSPDLVRTVVRWCMLESPDPFYREQWGPWSASALANHLPHMVNHYREHRAKSPRPKMTTLRYQPQPAYTPRAIEAPIEPSA
jgi:hypothetical protein